MSADVVWRGLQPGDTGRRVTAAAPPGVAAGPSGRVRPRRRPFGFAFADSEAIGLRCDLEAAPAPSPATAPQLTVIEIDGRELGDLLGESGDRRRVGALLGCPVRRRLVQQRIGRCFVAMTRGAETCFVQWLLDHSDNPALRHGFGDTFPHLLRDEALLEGGFTPAPFTESEIAPVAMARIAARAATFGIRWVHSFVPVDATATLRATVAAGFALHQLRVQRRRLWRRTTSFGPLPLDLRRQPA